MVFFYLPLVFIVGMSEGRYIVMAIAWPPLVGRLCSCFDSTLFTDYSLIVLTVFIYFEPF